MFCKHCGKELDDSATKCYSCGCDVNSPATNVYAILGLIFSFCGILGFVFSLCYSCGCDVNSPATNVYAILGLIFSFLDGILGFVFSLCGLSRAQKMGGEGAMMAKIGFAVSLVLMCLEVILLGLVIAEIAKKAM